MLVSDIEIFQKKKKKRSVNMIVNDIKNLLEDEKQRLAEYIKSYLKYKNKHWLNVKLFLNFCCLL